MISGPNSNRSANLNQDSHPHPGRQYRDHKSLKFGLAGIFSLDGWKNRYLSILSSEKDYPSRETKL
jgi:hypothetical protein